MKNLGKKHNAPISLARVGLEWVAGLACVVAMVFPAWGGPSAGAADLGAGPLDAAIGSERTVALAAEQLRECQAKASDIGRIFLIGAPVALVGGALLFVSPQFVLKATTKKMQELLSVAVEGVALMGLFSGVVTLSSAAAYLLWGAGCYLKVKKIILEDASVVVVFDDADGFKVSPLRCLMDESGNGGGWDFALQPEHSGVWWERIVPGTCTGGVWSS